MILASTQTSQGGSAGDDTPGSLRVFATLEDYTFWLVDVQTGDVREIKGRRLGETVRGDS